MPRTQQIVSASLVLKSVFPFIFLDIDVAEMPISFASCACVNPASAIRPLSSFEFNYVYPLSPFHFWNDFIITPRYLLVNPFLERFLKFLHFLIAFLKRLLYTPINKTRRQL